MLRIVQRQEVTFFSERSIVALDNIEKIKNVILQNMFSALLVLF